ncbi:MAG: DUF763 domain-containing protein [Candidatus Micrarchaeaceae archaeon]
MQLRKSQILNIQNRIYGRVAALRSITKLPLHGGKAPRWLFFRMAKLSKAICEVILDEYGADELLLRISDPNWFQALACAIGYDWHSSGTTTVTMAALKEVLNESGEIYIAGGKGKYGLKTPYEITQGTDLLNIPSLDKELVEFSRLAAKIDSSMVYDNFGIYHHTFIFTKDKWAVVQQGMSRDSAMAVRFQWNSDYVDKNDISNEPHSTVTANMRKSTLDLTYELNGWARKGSVEALADFQNILNVASYPRRHWINPQIDIGKKGMELIKAAGELKPSNYKELLLIKGVGRSTLRSLAFIASLIFDKELAQRDPVAFAYNLGGKDKIPFEINRKAYDSVIESMNEIISNAKLDSKQKYGALRRLSSRMGANKAPTD